ncbi:MAG: hypothetical protein HY075_03155, partial [Deltaproteobacteria bacterium]|nr:hypothetical protein [Deltaproteobacteria bacterium]
RIVSEACDDPAPDLKGGWSAERGVAVRHERNDGKDVLRVTELAGADKGKSTVVSFKKAGCTQRGKDRWECPIATHGLVTFAVKR